MQTSTQFSGFIGFGKCRAWRALRMAAMLGSAAAFTLACGEQKPEDVEAPDGAAADPTLIEHDVDTEAQSPIVDDLTSIAIESPEGLEPVALGDAAPERPGSNERPVDTDAGGENLGSVKQALVAPGYLAVWQSGSGGQFWRSGMYSGEFVQADTNFFNKGYRIKSVDVYSYKASCGTACTETRHQYTAVWEPGSGGQFWHSGMSASTFISRANTYGAQGYRIAALAADTNGYITAVWRPGGMSERAFTNMSSSYLASKDTEMWNAGFNMVQLVQTGNTFAAVWQMLGKAGVRTAWAQPYSTIVSWDKTFFNQGLRIQAMDIRGDKFAAIWHSGTTAYTQWWSSGLTASAIESSDKTNFKNGLRLKVLRVRKYSYADSPSSAQGTDGGGMQQPPSCNSTMYTSTARVDRCWNLDGFASNVVTPGSITGTGWGCTLSAAQANAKTSLSTALGQCVSTSAIAGCCSFAYE